MRSADRSSDQLRAFSIERGIQPQADGSILISTGNTQVVCGVSVEERVPAFLEGSNQGWITAEYGMLPCATSTRSRRETNGRSGRSMEIQRLIGRSLRMTVDLTALQNFTLRVDCDVLNADGGTRTAAITGAALAVRDAIIKLTEEGKLENPPDLLPVAAVSVGIVGGKVLLDLDYLEDSSAEADGNFVMTAEGKWIEIQATAENGSISEQQFTEMMTYARKGIGELLSLWQADI
ncbi:MAG: ribonuclease PH [Desulfobulbaceae bacterium]|nr:MAG: ribonuclease PH [Desulfobulbaceae bacterium]